MITQHDADSLIEILKSIKDVNSSFQFPIPGDCRKIELMSDDGRHSFIVDVNRKGSANLVGKCTYQGRYQKDTPLLRLDLCGPDHTNPDGISVGCNHLHIYKEGYGDRFAIEIPEDFINTQDFVQTLIDFLVYFKTVNAKLLDIEVVV